MKRKLMTVGVMLIVAVVAVVFTQLQPDRLTASTLQKANEVQRKLDQASTDMPIAVAQADAKPAEAKPAEAKPAEPKPAEPVKPAEPKKDEANNVFKVKFECSNGTFTVECHRDWAPLGAARFEELVKAGYYNEARFFRVVPGFVAQFGIAGNPETTAKWRVNRLKDDPVKQSNSPGTLVFATSGPNTRTTQLFINYGDNKRLDGMGFSPFGKVIDGMDVVKAICSEYGEKPSQPRMEGEGNAYLLKEFPKLDFIKSATIVP